MADEPTDDQARQQARSNSAAMNTRLRGEAVEGDADAEPADFNASIRKAAGRPYQTKTEEQA